MEKIASKKLLGGILVVVVLGWFVVSIFSTPVEEGEIPETQGATSSIPAVKAPSTTTKAPVTVGDKPVSISYQNALDLYKEGKRLQITGSDTFCQVTPNNVMYKNGTSIMIDNRSPLSHTIKVGTTYTIEGYGFRIIKLSSTSLPATLVMDCDKQQNIAKILLQK